MYKLKLLKMKKGVKALFRFFFILREDQNFNLSFKSGGILTIFPSLSTKA